MGRLETGRLETGRLETGRLEAVRAQVGRAGLDALLVTDPADLRLLTGFSASAGTLVLATDEARLLMDPRYAGQAEAQTGLSVTEYPRLEFWLEALLALCRPYPRIGAQAEHLSAATWLGLAAHLGERLVPADGLLREVRALKDADGIAQLTRAAALTWQALTLALEQLREGMTERELAGLVARGLYDGADGPAFPVIAAFGAHTADPHAAPGTRRLERGDLVLLDAGAKLAGWHADVTVTTVFGQPSPEQAARLELVASALQAAEHAARPGATAGEVDEAARRVLRDAGYDAFTLRGVGHGVGLAVHEAPRLVEKGAQALEDAHAFTLEPGLYLPGWGGVRLERMYALVQGTLKPLSPWPLVYSPDHSPQVISAP